MLLRTRKAMILVSIALGLLVNVPCETFAERWLSGETHFYWRDTIAQAKNISGVSMCKGDVLMVRAGTGVSFYTVNPAGNSGTTTQQLPYWMAPNSSLSGNTLAGVSMWQLADFTADNIRGRTLVIDNTITADKLIAGVSTFNVNAGVTLTRDMMAGGIIRVWAAAPIRIGVPTLSGTSQFFMVVDYYGSGVTIQTTNGQILYGISGSETGVTTTSYFLNPGNSRGSASFEIVVIPGVTTFIRALGVQKTWNIK